LTFTVPGPPRPKKRARTSFFDKRGRLRVHPATGKPKPVTYTPKQTVAYEAAVRVYALAARNRLKTPWPLDARYRVSIRFRIAGALRVDISNLCKTHEDACNGVLWVDDSQIDELHLVAERGCGHANTCAIVSVEAIANDVQARNVPQSGVPSVAERTRAMLESAASRVPQLRREGDSRVR